MPAEVDEMAATTSSPTVRKAAVPHTFDTWVWLFMRWSGLALIPLAWGHVLLQDVIVGVHRIDLNYAAWRWSFLGWQIYDIALLGFAFAHGMNGLRYVVNDYVHNEGLRKNLNRAIFVAWLVITLIGGVAIFGSRAVHAGLTFDRAGEALGFGLTIGNSGAIALAIVAVLFVVIGGAFLAFGRSRK
jgi:succinate dehydrogenase / fumarate reductase membrane anchor subunit